MASSKQRRKALRQRAGTVVNVTVENARPVVLVVGQLSAREEFVGTLVRRLHRHAGVDPGHSAVHRDDAIIAGTRYVGANAGHHFEGLADVDDVVVLHGARPEAVAAAHRRLLLTRRPGPAPMLPHQLRFLGETSAAQLLPHQQQIVDDAFARINEGPVFVGGRTGGHAAGAAALLGYRGVPPTFLPRPPVRIDVDALVRMGQGDRVAALRQLGRQLRRFAPEAADYLDTYDGADHGPPLPDPDNPFLPADYVNHLAGPVRPEDVPMTFLAADNVDDDGDAPR